MNLTTADAVPEDAESVAVAVAAGPIVLGDPHGLDEAGLAARGFAAKPGEVLVLPAEGRLVVAVGVGEADAVTADVLRRAAAHAVRSVWKSTSLALAFPEAATAGQAMAEGAALAAYRFGRFKSDPEPCRIETVTVVGAAPEAVGRAGAVVGAVTFARDLVNTPAGSLTPGDMAAAATAAAEQAGIGVEVLDQGAIEELGLGGLLGVARGSEQPPRLIKLTYDPAGATTTVALVGKGITFDSGGLSLKSAAGMETMKCDMGGGAAVIAAMCALPALAAPVRVIGFVPTTENMPGGRATKPGDVLTTRNGTTVEVLNTDAEGRLVLADGLALAAEEQPVAIVDLATLTGACVTALGPRIAGLMGTSPSLLDAVEAAAGRAGEAVWPLPLPDDLRAQLDSDVADLRNIAKVPRGGALIAGLFLREFVDGVPWAHLDIAGPAWADEDDGPVARGGTGFGVRTLLELLTADPPVLGAVIRADAG